ncbi:MAG TPA: cyclic nucleotide-binding/CBS domain-containing protein [Persephonella sp.]|uniref:Putative nucleotidyltransferase family n=1 Tax=Persephonella marina (strain DSM 14350 / EX-H1) TaxID=123214 RepID=C0QPN0_PERMH|nr:MULTISPECIES: putative nucleotidyltransferase substrate binding domain-containing protein [Persephonella]ACO03558.1 putative nucleotidyltransferase family [Persephonella marina EX-H1]HCB69759.1 cyclic nucleotide-binding/CBS domain-containing protein [Persephonella sp.]
MSIDLPELLKNTEPFSLLSEEEIDYIISNSLLDYIPKNSIILDEKKRSDYLYLVIKGVLSLLKDNTVIELLESGEILKDPSGFKVKAEDDSILLLIPSKVIQAILKEHPEFKDHFEKSITKKISEGSKKLRSVSYDDISLLTLKSIDLRPAVFCDEEDSVTQVAKKMSSADTSCCLVGREDSIKGIITDKDLKDRVLAKGHDPSKIKASDIKTYPVEFIESDRFLFEAVLKMIRKNIKRLPVLEEGKVIGVVEDRDILVRQSRNILYLIGQIEDEYDIKNLSQIYKSLKLSVEEIFNTGKDIEIIQKYISEINDRFVRKAVEISLEKLDIKGRFSFVLFGSEGRREVTISTDIDNGIIFSDRDEREKFLRLGREVVGILLRIGFPRCEGNVMASNERWVKSLDDWKNVVEEWISKPDAENILMTGIFFDFRNAYGDETLTDQLQDFIFSLIEKNQNFLLSMALKTLELEPPVGFFGRFTVEKSGEHKNELDLKKGGILPIVSGVRVLSLENKIRSTNTIDRIRKLRKKLGENLSDELIESFKFLQTLRLKNQIEKIKEGKSPDNYINPEKLTRFEKDILKESFRIIKKFQEMLGVHFRLRV